MVRSSLTKLMLLSGVLLILLSAGTVMRDLTFPDELRYAEVSREMLDSSNWILPHFNYEIYAEKPPFFFWMISACMKAFGIHPLSAMLPTIFSALLTILVTYLMGKELYDDTVGLYGSWILSTFIIFLFMAQVVRMDMTLTLLVTTSLYLFYKGIKESGRSICVVLAGYLLIGIALMTKGPVGLLLPMIILLSYLIVTKRIHTLRYLYPARGFMITAVIPLLWLVLAGLQGGEAYIKEILLTQSTGRIITSFSHARPFYYYLLYFPFFFVPWSFFLLLFLDTGIRKRLVEEKEKLLFLLSWFLGTLIFFSLISGKVIIYLLPLLPALALLIARVFTLIRKDQKVLHKPYLFKIPAYLICGICLLGPAVFYTMDLRAAFINEWSNIFPIIFILIFFGIILFYPAHRLYIVQTLFTTGLISIFFTATVTLWVVPRINPILSLRPMAQRILAIEKDHPRTAGYNVHFPFLAYYLHTPYVELMTNDALRTFVQKDRGFLIINQQYLNNVMDSVNVTLMNVGRFNLKGITYLLLLIQESPESVSDLTIG